MSGALRPLDVETAVTRGLAALGGGREEVAIPELVETARAQPGHAPLWQALGLLHRAAQNSLEAIEAFDRAAGLAPNDAKIAHGLAQTLYEGGLPSLEAFQRAAELAPNDLSVVRGMIAARLAEQGPGAAIELADQVMRVNPLWLEGHWVLSRLRYANGETDGAMASIERAVAGRPHEANLWLQWLYILMKGERFNEALALLPRIRVAIGALPFLDLFEAYLLSETGSVDDAEAIFGVNPPPNEIGLAIHRVRHELRVGRPQMAETICSRWKGTAEEHHVFPYLSIAWRLTGDSRWEGLEGLPALVGTYDIRSDITDFDRLVEVVRGLHNQQGQPLEQSLRGGTQTDGPLLSRIEPEIRNLRAALCKAITKHIAGLPPARSGHPQLSWARDLPIRFAGSWSVRFQGSGHHSGHVHPDGWFSSALYLALPDAVDREQSREGWLALGEPHETLGIDLPELYNIQPKLGHLTLFPSTMWHGTVPYSTGERMSVAFDVATPPQRLTHV